MIKNFKKKKIQFLSKNKLIIHYYNQTQKMKIKNKLFLKIRKTKLIPNNPKILKIKMNELKCFLN